MSLTLSTELIDLLGEFWAAQLYWAPTVWEVVVEILEDCGPIWF